VVTAEDILADDKGHTGRWGALTRADRLRLMKALRQGTELQDRVEAATVVQEARRQVRYWRLIWLLGPAAALFQLDQGAAAVIGAVVAGAAVTGGLAVWQIRRARRAEAINLAVATGEAARLQSEARRQEKLERQRSATNLGPRREGRPDPNTSASKRKRRKR